MSCKNCGSNNTYYVFNDKDNKRDLLICDECKAEFYVNLPFEGSLFDDSDLDN
jgi:transcription elongation factor Elf1